MRVALAVVLSGLGLAAHLVGAAAPPIARGRTATRPTAKSAQLPAEAASFEREVAPFVKKYCEGCHGAKLASADIAFHTFTTQQSVTQNRRLWERLVKNLQSHRMPPRNAVQPTERERQRVVTWVESTLSVLDCTLKDAGRVTMRRLNRNEYTNTIRDLFGTELKAAEDFPSDDVGYGFDNLGDVLSLSPIHLERYLAAAENIAARVIVTPEPPPPFAHLEAESMKSDGSTAVLGNGYRGLYAQTNIESAVKIPSAGLYTVRIRAYGQQAGDEMPKMEVRFGDTPSVIEVPALQAAPKTYELKLQLPAGERRLDIGFINDFNDRRNPDMDKRDRNLFIDWVEVSGPQPSGPQSLPESHKRIFVVQPEKGKEQAAARTILTKFLRRAYRRPVTAEEVDRLARFVDMARKEGESFERGIQLAVQAALVSPSFLFRVEVDPAGSDSLTMGRPLNDHELAARLSYFLWSSMPDDELFSLADQGILKDPKVLAAQSRRMLKDPRSKALVENFAMQWLTLRNLKNVNPDPAMFPSFNEGLRQAMQKETELFFASIMNEDRSILDLLDAKYTYLNETLARHYGIPWVKGDQFRRVVLKGDQRGGILTQASILTVTSNPTRTSPVKRGKWVLEQLLATPPPPPIPNVPELKVEQGMLTGTLRQKMEQHRKDPLCASCHSQMDPIGFGLENYDAVGGWRDKEGQFPVDSSGVLPDGKTFNGPMQLIQILKSHKQDFCRAFTEQMMTYALGRGLKESDRCVVREVTDRVGASGYRFSNLVTEIVTSDPFRLRKVEKVGK